MAMKIGEEIEGIEYFECRCPYCSTENIDLRPLGLSYTYRKDNDNRDIKDEMIRKQLDAIPYIGEVLLSCNEDNIIINCKECGMASRPDKPLSRTKIAAYLRKNDMEPVMNLRIG